MSLLSLFGIKSKRQQKVETFLENNGIIVDVRSKAEFDMGHAPDSVNVPLESIKHKTGKLRSLKRPIVAVCRSGARSGSAVALLNAEGIESVNGGSWRRFV